MKLMPYNIREADMRAYESLKSFHYVPGDPAVPTRILAAYPGAFCTPVAVIVEAHPVLQARARNLAFPGRYTGLAKFAAANRINADLRTIARVIVHPSHRGHRLAERLVKALIARRTSPILEVFSAQPHGFFESAGMTALRTPEALTLDTFYYFFTTLRLHPPQ